MKLQSIKNICKRFTYTVLMCVLPAYVLKRELHKEIAWIFIKRLRSRKYVPGWLTATWRKLYLWADKRGRGRFVYTASAKLVFWLCGRRWIQQLHFRLEVALMRHLLVDLHIPPTHQRSIAQQYLMNIVWLQFMRYWQRILDDPTLELFSQNELNRIVAVNGWSHFQQAYDQGDGVILAHYHATNMRFIWPYLKQRGFDIDVNIGGIGRRLGVRGLKVMKKVEYGRKLFMAQTSLKDGGLVCIVPDGYGGNGGLSLSFHNRTREFRTTFAELALNTGARVVPAFITMDRHGQFHVKFHAALDPGSDTLSRQERIKLLVTQYVDHVEKQWASAPEALMPKGILQHLTDPKTQPAFMNREVQQGSPMASRVAEI